MKNFKELLWRDLKNTFYRTDEFAEERTIEYDGKIKKIPVIFDYEAAEDREITIKDKAEGLYKVDVIIRVQLEDMGETPRKGKSLYIDDDSYTVQKVTTEYGEIILELESIDE